MDSLRFLTVEQSLADIAHFVEHLRVTTPGANRTTPVIIQSYDLGGSLAVWFHQRYPHLTKGVWAHRANVQALQDNKQYGENVVNSLRRIVGSECYAVIEDGCRGLEAKAQAGELVKLSALLNICDAPLQSDQVSFLFYAMFQLFSELITP